MIQEKCKIMDIDSFTNELICKPQASTKIIYIQNTFKGKEIGDFILVEYNQYSRENKIQGKLVASTINNRGISKREMYSQQFQASTFDELLWDKGNRDQSEIFNWLPKFKPTEEKEMQNHLVELLLKNFYTVGINFKNSSKSYTYKVGKDIELAEEDQVIVQTTTGFEIVTVNRVDEGMNIDLASDIKYKFIVQKVDLTQYQELCDKDKNVSAVIATTEAEKKRKELVEEFTGSLSDQQVSLLEDCGVKAVKRL